MKPDQIVPNNPETPNQSTSQRTVRGRALAKLWLIIGAAILAGWLGTPRAAAQAYSATNTWTGAGGDPYWPTAGNWTGGIVPTPASLAILTNYGPSGLPGTNGSGAVGSPNIIVSNDTSLASLYVMNTNLTGAGAVFHTIQVSNGVTLTISNNPTSPQINVLQVCSQSGAGAPSNVGTDNGVNQRIFCTIQGEGGTLAVVATNGLGTTFGRGNIFVGQGSLGLSGGSTIDPLNAILDLSGLDNFQADVNHILLGDGGVAGFFFNRPAGTIYFAKTNLITLWAVGNHPSAGSVANHGFMTGVLAQNNGGGLRRTGKFVLGYTNAIFCNTGIGLGIRGCSGWLGFNPSNAPGNSTAYFRDRAGTGRQNSWAIGNRLGATSTASQDVRGELDFSQGTVDALVGTLGIAVNSQANLIIGTVEFGAGTIDANTLQLGVQTASSGSVQGTLTVSNSAVLKINTSGTLGGAAGNPGVSFARLIVTDGGTVQFANTAPVPCGAGSSSEIKLLNGSKLTVLSIGTPSAPLTSLQISNSTLTVDRGILSNPTVAPVVVSGLNAAGTNTVDVLGTVLVAGRFPLIKYTTLVNGGFTNFVLGSTSPGVVAYLTNNAANSTFDVVVTSSLTTVLTWDGRTNGVDVSSWDIGGTTNWQGGLPYSQASVPGSLVRFDDTAAGAGTATFDIPNLAPADIMVTNSSKSYTFNGTGGLVGPGALTKDGNGSLVLGNSGSNGFTGGILVNNGTLQLSGSPDRLPTSGIVTFADVSGTTLDLNNLDQTVGGLAGGGASGGDVALGTANLTIRSGGSSYGGAIGGAGALIKNGSGTQTLSGSSTYSGGTVISNAALLVINSSGSGLGSGPVNIGTNGTLQLGNGAMDGAIDATVITNNGSLNLNPANNLTLAKLIVGSGSVIKPLGNGTTIYVTNANSYTGASVVQQGVLQISHPDALGSGPITVGNATGTDTYLALSGDITLTNAITLSGKTGAIVPSPVGINNVTDINSGQPGTNTISGPITVTGATAWSVGSDAGKLIVSGNFINGENAILGRFFLRGTAEGVWASTLYDASPSLRLTLDKNDSGTWTMTKTNTYTGRTVINAGTLVIDGALNGSSNVLVFPGAALAGSGTISGAVTNSGSIFPGGDGITGALSINNALLLDFGSLSSFEVSTNGNDQIRGLTTVVYGGTLKVNLTGTLTGNCIFKLFSAQTYAGAFDGFDLPDISPLTWDSSQLPVDGTLRAVGAAVVTPAITSIAANGSGGFVIAGTGTLVAPFDILASTNVALPLVNWSNIGGGTFSNGFFFFNDVTATNYHERFYLLTTPSP